MRSACHRPGVYLAAALAVLALTTSPPAWAWDFTEPRVLPGPPGSVRVIDHLGRERTIQQPITRAVVLGGAVSETLWALGAGEAIIARSEWTNWPPAMAQRPSIGSIAQPNLELLWRLKPQVIIADSHYHGVAARLESLGAPVVFLNGYVQPQIRGLVLALGELFQKPDRARELIAFLDRMGGLLADRLSSLTPEDRPRVFLGYGEQLFFTSNAKSGRQLVDLAGGLNIADALPFPYQRVSAEWLVDQAPDHLVLGADLTSVGFKVVDREYMLALREAARKRPGLRSLDCVAQGRVCVLNQRISYGLRGLIGAVYLARAFHPDLMAGIEPTKLHREMLGRFFGLELDGCYFAP